MRGSRSPSRRARPPAGRPPAARAKLVSRRRARELVRRAQRRGESVVFTSGCFDLLHVGHVRSLEDARRHGERLVVAVNSDASVRGMKGIGRPIVPARQRAEVLAALACVDWVVVFPEATPRRILDELRPDVYAKGGDWPLAVLRAQDLPAGFAGRVVRLRQVPGVRTTRIVERVRRSAVRRGAVRRSAVRRNAAPAGSVPSG